MSGTETNPKTTAKKSGASKSAGGDTKKKAPVHKPSASKPISPAEQAKRDARKQLFYTDADIKKITDLKCVGMSRSDAKGSLKHAHTSVMLDIVRDAAIYTEANGGRTIKAAAVRYALAQKGIQVF